MALGESAKVVWSNILYAPFINFAGGNVTGGYQVAQPLRGVWVVFIEIRGQGAFSVWLRGPSSSCKFGTVGYRLYRFEGFLRRARARACNASFAR
jgi:hypothetical protein